MARRLYGASYHYRGGAFGKAEQHFENRFNDMIEEIRMKALGFTLPVEQLTKKKNGIVDTDLILKTAEEIVNTSETLGADERDFYRSFFYCALTLCSVDFTYYLGNLSNGRRIGDFTSTPVDFQFLVEQADTEKDEKGTGLSQNSTYSDFIPYLYELLTGKTFQLHTVFHNYMDDLSPKALQEMGEDLAEELRELPGKEDFGPEDWEEEEPDSESEIEEENRLEAEKVKLIYPGYQDFIKHADQMAALMDDCLSDAFFTNVRDMVSAFLAYKGFTVFQDEKTYVDLMAALNRARRVSKGAGSPKEGR